jgi:saccharopine dehydrogenase-like NADP-dependent oxidoreductase
VVGLGAVGARVAHQLVSGAPQAGEPIVLIDRDAGRLEEVAGELGAGARARLGGAAQLPDDLDVAILTVPEGVRPAAEAALERGAHAVLTCDVPQEVRSLLALDAEARERELCVVAGAAMAPGLSCVLSRYAAQGFERVSELHVASVGTGGPACARRHHVALSSVSVDWDGAWRRRPGGSGRELLWFPEPVGGADCYRAALADPYLLVPAFPGVRRVTARLQATRRDRMTAWLPMLRPPHPEGLVGAVRVEVRGWVKGAAVTTVLGVTTAPALAAGVVAATAAVWAGTGRLSRPGAAGLAELIGDPAGFLAECDRRGVHTSVFDGGRGAAGPDGG